MQPIIAEIFSPRTSYTLNSVSDCDCFFCEHNITIETSCDFKAYRINGIESSVIRGLSAASSSWMKDRYIEGQLGTLPQREAITLYRIISILESTLAYRNG